MDDTTIVGGSARAAAMQGGWQGGWNGVSWSAVIAGALTAIAVAMIIIALGTGIGMEVASPYASSPSAATMTIIGALWLVFAQAVGFAVGGYVAGRLRRPPATQHSDEVKFRDGANGLVVWAIGVVVSSFILVAAVDKIGAAVGTTAAAAGQTSSSIDYFTDALLRPNPQSAVNGAAAGTPNLASNTQYGVNGNQPRAQIYRIMLTGLGPNGVSNDDRTYLAQIVSQQTGMSQNDAQSRVDAVVHRAKDTAAQAAEAARKAAAYLSFWTFMSLLFGAVCATLGGILGGDLRDEFARRTVVQPRRASRKT